MDKLWSRAVIGLFIGSALANFSVWIDFLVILTLTSYIYHASAFLMAFVSALILGPSVFLGPRLGRLVDAANNPSWMLISSLVLRGSTTAFLLFMPSFPLFCLIVFFRSVMALPEYPASNALTAQIISPSDVPRYFGLLGLLRGASKIGAPTLGVVLASIYGVALAIQISIGMTLFASVTIIFAFYKKLHIFTNKNKYFENHKEKNIKELKSDKNVSDYKNISLMKMLLWTVTTYSFMVFFINNQLPVLLRNAGFNMILLGVLVSSSGAGGIFAASYLSRRRRSKQSDTMNPMRATIVSVNAIAFCFVALGGAFMLPLSIAPYVAAILFFCTGIFSTTEAIRANVVVVQGFPKNAGEITAKLSAFRNFAMLIAPWFSAIFMHYDLSISVLFIVDGGIGLMIMYGILHVYKHFNPKTGHSPTLPG
ncbi:MFS transporter [Acidithiobacillus thiooxidans]|uniref:MFS transporter n=1 Tax=Acidithiobacillus thiooxidans TaxID=930 RepID=UPI00285AB37B|nr:MFS transporter [Acidithiobacillus thiooxidans]MDR7927421.1 MFS transporter [Acidithiobacillus thiooxidans]